MTGTLPDHEFKHLNDEVRNIWDTNADFWNFRMGEGNSFHNSLIMPTQLALLDIQPGQHVLDIACGNGNFARQMADCGAHVIGVDISSRMIKNAIASNADYGERVQFLVADATDKSALRSLGETPFDAISCTMAIMDIASIEPLSFAINQLLKPGGRFIYSVMHPSFNSIKGMVRVADRIEA